VQRKPGSVDAIVMCSLPLLLFIRGKVYFNWL
jgi:ABC-type transport system involved in cytochrome c biogenesis permease component